MPAVIVTLDGKTVEVVTDSFKETVAPLGVDWDDWIGTSGHRRVHLAKGAVKTWVLVGFEDAQEVDWEDSMAFQCRYWLWHNTVIAFSLQFGTAGAVHSVSADVYVMACEVWYDAAWRKRYYSVQLMEA